MTVRNDVVLWDNGEDRLSLFSVPPEQQYKYIEGKPCVTFGLSYENKNYKGCDIFTVFDRFYTELIDEMEKTLRSLRGGFRIEDKGADTDGYVDLPTIMTISNVNTILVKLPGSMTNKQIPFKTTLSPLKRWFFLISR